MTSETIATAPGKYNTMAVIGLITALFAWPLGFVFSSIARQQLKADPTQLGHGLAKWGLIVSWISTGLIIFVVFIYMFLGLALAASF